MLDYLNEIMSQYRHKTLTSAEASSDVEQLLDERQVSKALELFQNRSDEVNEAIKEYNPQTHKVMNRPNKPRKGQRPYITEKLPRNRQKYINEVELFFIFGQPLKFTLTSGDDDAYALFTDFLKSSRFDAKMRQIKRLAGSETECAKLYHLYNDGGKIGVKTVVLARSTGYELRPLFNQYGDLIAFAYGFKIKSVGKEQKQHWNIETANYIYEAENSNGVWAVDKRPNPTGRINVIYYKQPKAWAGVEPRIAREEMLDSKKADTNNYFADPIAKASADVIQSLADPQTTGKLIKMNGANSTFDYVQPPQSSELRRDEQESLERSILFDTFTPDFSFENMKGFGSVSGVAIRNSMILGFMKADNRKEIYSEMIDRDINLMRAVLAYQHPDKAKALEELRIDFEYAQPFGTDDIQTQKDFVVRAYQAGLCTLETAVRTLDLADNDKEIEELKKKAEQAQKQDKTPVKTEPKEVENGEDNNIVEKRRNSEPVQGSEASE